MNDVLIKYNRNEKRNVKFNKTKIYRENGEVLQIRYLIQGRTYVAEYIVMF